ncbi:hypothetical protein AWJ20_668 [Sugiyamaella lignohabitans]|uniref:Protein kinase domain-containing protein n=1 Tax=Sugiyamaella lignohabitans TaxID=796027 RepID=A0A167D302_9ASCO|nr:uncharacterized protein AWJ20_668 [Sugiyamaella lignohabitans]ANB12415.1 hypothetical protein AWJ20_668 [Sugiyamaella lignohabitans]
MSNVHYSGTGAYERQKNPPLTQSDLNSDNATKVESSGSAESAGSTLSIDGTDSSVERDSHSSSAHDGTGTGSTVDTTGQFLSNVSGKHEMDTAEPVSDVEMDEADDTSSIQSTPPSYSTNKFVSDSITANSGSDPLSNLISSLSTDSSPIAPFPGRGPAPTNPIIPTTVPPSTLGEDTNLSHTVNQIPIQYSNEPNIVFTSSSQSSDNTNNYAGKKSVREPLKLQIPPTSSTSSYPSSSTSSYWDQQLASPFEVVPFPSPLIGPSEGEDYDSMALFRAFNGRSSPMSATVSRASSIRRPTSMSPQDKLSISSPSPIAPITIAAASAALSSLKRQQSLSKGQLSSSIQSQDGLIPSATINTPSTPREKRIVSEYVPVANNPANNILPPRLPGILADKPSRLLPPADMTSSLTGTLLPQPPHQSPIPLPLYTTHGDQPIIIKKRDDQQQQDNVNRSRSNSDLKTPPLRPLYGRSSSSEHVRLIEKLHRERIPNLALHTATSSSSSSGQSSNLNAGSGLVSLLPTSYEKTSPLSKSSSTASEASRLYSSASSTSSQELDRDVDSEETISTVGHKQRTSEVKIEDTTSTGTKETTLTVPNQLSETVTSPPATGRIYEAYDIKKRRSTWREISLLGRGAFSRVVLAKPVERFVIPSYREKVDSILVAIKIVELGAAGGGSRERIESGLGREIEILKVCIPSLLS